LGEKRKEEKTMRIIVIDDCSDELRKAVGAVEAAGHEVISFSDCKSRYPNPDVWEQMADADGVITDLYFNPKRSNDRVMEEYSRNTPPMGLVVALHALHIGKPVVICTSGDHHGSQLSFVFDAYVSPTSRKIGFGWEEDKDWARAVKMLEQGAKSTWDLK